MNGKMGAWENAQKLMENYGRQLIFFATKDGKVGEYNLNVGGKGISIEGFGSKVGITFTEDTKDIIQRERAVLDSLSLDEDLGNFKVVRYTVTPELLIREQVAGQFPRTKYVWKIDAPEGENNLKSLGISTHLHATVQYHEATEFQRNDDYVHGSTTILDSDLPRSLVGVEKLPYLKQDICWRECSDLKSEKIISMMNLERLVRQL